MNHSAHKPLILERGTVIADRYIVQSLLGFGASAKVYLCRDTEIGNLPVAIKLLLPNVIRSHLGAARLQRELRMAFRIHHDHVIRFYNTVRDHEGTGYSMEYVEGRSLEDLIAADRIDFDRALMMFMQICSGVAGVHRAGVLHRDIKPANIIIRGDGLLKLGDLGLAIEPDTRDDDHAEPKQQGHAPPRLVGTPLYMSPEYLSAGIFDQRSDLYSLGLVGYELFAGRPPFVSDSIFHLIRRRVEDETQDIRELVPEMPFEVGDILMQLLQREPAARTASASNVMEDLRAAWPRVASQRLSRPRASSIELAIPRQSGIIRRTLSFPKRAVTWLVDYVLFVFRAAAVPERLLAFAERITGSGRVWGFEAAPSSFSTALVVIAALAMGGFFIFRPHIKSSESSEISAPAKTRRGISLDNRVRYGQIETEARPLENAP